MKHKISRWSCGIAVASLAALALVACDNETLAGPSFNSTNSSLTESSSSEIVARPTCDALSPECGYTVEELCRMGETRYCKTSSSSSAQSSSSELRLSSMCNAFLPECGYSVEELCRMGRTYYCQNSSSSVARSSSSNEWCKHVTDVECEPCPPGEKCICHPCDPNKDRESYDCATYTDLKCIDGEWQTPDEFCPNGRWTTSCGNKEFHEPVCCTEEMRGTCKHISDYDGMTEQGNCVGQNGLTAVDCETDANYICKDNYWQPVACLNIKPDECKPGMGGCGYRLCEPKGIREIADCETSVRYYCDGETWQVVGNVYNKRCADGELDQCEACFNEGVINGQYQCNNGRWKKLGKGDDIKDCELEKEGCAIPVCNALTPECGYSEYELCSKYGIDRYCNDKWLSEPCDGSESSRDLRILESNNSFRLENYICVNNKWVERFKYYECGEDVDCDRPSLRCQESSVIGTACENEGESSEIDGCVFLCSAGRFLYAPPPM